MPSSVCRGSDGLWQDLLSNISCSYTIAFTPRSGSNHLCDLLTRAGIGRPTEYFQYDSPAWEVRDPGTAVVGAIRNNIIDGVFGSKIGHHHHAWLRKAIAGITGSKAHLDDVFPNHHWIRLVRKDKIAQAVSLYKAQRTQQWIKWWNEDHDRVVEAPYDFDAILTAYHSVMTSELVWEVYFVECGASPITIVYEEFAERPSHTVTAIANNLGLKKWNSVEGAKEHFLTQRDENSESLGAKFRADLIERT